jgi:IS5 family transposase
VRFKARANVDEDGFINRVHLTAGKVHDSTQFEKLLTGSEAAAYADSAYKSKKHSELLKDRGVEERITHRAYRNTPLKMSSTNKTDITQVFVVWLSMCSVSRSYIMD